ncbi:protein BREVIS RADIX-like [Silene latifolia]|uniref:protein BREVIS RADIX-like n=1 Tax=Silene latifolia TaxID=37657 RepID=UPI003D781AC8
MLTCITCAKQTDEKDEERGGRGSGGTANTRDSTKGITSQLKDMALKISGASKQYKPGTSSGDFKKGDRSYLDYDTASEGGRYSYYQAGSSSSTPAWDFPSNTHNQGVRSHSRFAGGRESIADSETVIEDEDEPKEWMAQVEPGVHITFVSLPNGGNDLKRIRFSRDMFNKWQAQRWWGENYDRIMELYNVQRFNRQALQTPARSDDEPRDSTYTRVGSVMESPMTNKEWIPRNFYQPPGSKAYYPSEQGYPGGASGYNMGAPREAPYMDPARTTTSSRDDVSVSNASELETEWIEEDEPGVYITIRQLADGSRELRRVRFSREKFGEMNAKTWWEQNRERIQAQYL